MVFSGLIKEYRREISLAVALLFTMVIGLMPALVERFYSNGFYLVIAAILRTLFGWIPFSVGDLFYGLAFLLILCGVFRFFRRLLRKEVDRKWWVRTIRQLLRLAMVIYLVFQWIWGLNYHRLGSAYQLDINPETYTRAELIELTDTLNSRLTALVPALTTADTMEWQDFALVKKRCLIDYRRTAKVFPFLKYSHASVKQMLVGSIGGYGGFSGYLNPFTGEAQLNSNMPPFLRASVACHEIGHQLGYAAEEEANMVGYLVARQSANPAVRYSAYHDLFTYAGSELYSLDSNAYHDLMKRVSPLVKVHRKQARDYYDSFKNPVQLLVSRWYDLYLKANSQPKGLRSYSYVTAWLIAYAKKYGWRGI